MPEYMQTRRKCVSMAGFHGWSVVLRWYRPKLCAPILEEWNQGSKISLKRNLKSLMTTVSYYRISTEEFGEPLLIEWV